MRLLPSPPSHTHTYTCTYTRIPPFHPLCSFVTENTTEQELFALVDKICPFLDPQIASVCPAMVEQMGPIVLQALVERENPEVLCTQLKFCDKKNSTRVEPHLE